MPPVNINLCGTYSNDTQIELGQMCDDKRRCSNAMNGTAACRCDWVGKWTPRDGLDHSDCVCEEDQKGLNLIEVDGKCICPDNKQNVPFEGCVIPATECGSDEIKACYDLTGCIKDGAIKYQGYREGCDRPCVAKCVSKDLVKVTTSAPTIEIKPPPS
uniref:Uncharacterized protein n=1 Tax=Acrobeloides nanus TaxID=290746 RepID=A0A914EEV9_9BILA